MASVLAWIKRGGRPAQVSLAAKDDEAIQRDLAALDETLAKQRADGGADDDKPESPAQEFKLDEPTSAEASPNTVNSLSVPEYVVSDSEKELLAQLRAKIDPDLKPGVPLDVALDWTLIRCLRARRGNLDQAAELYKSIIDWRKVNNIDQLLPSVDPNEDVVMSVCPHRHHGVDKEGHPVYYEGTGKVRICEMMAHGLTEEDVVMRHVRFMEYMIKRMIASSQKRGHYVGKMVNIHDMAGMSYSVEAAGFRIFRRTTFIDQNYYPECLHRMIIINAPFSFRGIWAIIKPWLDPKTRAKVEIYGANYQDRLRELIPLDQLPAMYGGTCTCEGVHDNGDGCMNPVRKVERGNPMAPPAWPTVPYDPVDVEGGKNHSPFAPEPVCA